MTIGRLVIKSRNWKTVKSDVNITSSVTTMVTKLHGHNTGPLAIYLSLSETRQSVIQFCRREIKILNDYKIPEFRDARNQTSIVYNTLCYSNEKLFQIKKRYENRCWKQKSFTFSTITVYFRRNSSVKVSYPTYIIYKIYLVEANYNKIKRILARQPLISRFPACPLF